MENDTDDLVSLGHTLRSARLNAKLSIRRLAAQLGMHHSYIARLEDGSKKNPSLEVLQKLANTLGLDAHELIGHVGVRPSRALPSPRSYFRRKFGVSEDEADILARLVEHKLKQEKENGAHETTNQEGGD